MDCENGCYYQVIPPRVWSRVQSDCGYLPLSNSQTQGPISAQLNKGNILQYKGNSSRLSAAQRYSKVAQGKWTNRNTTWATQSTRGYTNPNTQQLKRNGFTNITLAGIPTFEPITCPSSPIPTIYTTLPISNTPINPLVLPASYLANNPILPEVAVPEPESPIVVQNGGTMICNVNENLCTGEEQSQPANQLCHPSSASDVPGNGYLCWNDGVQTWFPRQRLTMSNSGNKFPVNYKTLVSALHCR